MVRTRTGRVRAVLCFVGDLVRLELPEATFPFKIEETRIGDDKALWVKRRVGYDRLVLTACHPLYSAKQRIVACARFEGKPPSIVKG